MELRNIRTEIAILDRNIQVTLSYGPWGACSGPCDSLGEAWQKCAKNAFRAWVKQSERDDD